MIQIQDGQVLHALRGPPKRPAYPAQGPSHAGLGRCSPEDTCASCAMRVALSMPLHASSCRASAATPSGCLSRPGRAGPNRPIARRATSRRPAPHRERIARWDRTVPAAPDRAVWSRQDFSTAQPVRPVAAPQPSVACALTADCTPFARPAPCTPRAVALGGNARRSTRKACPYCARPARRRGADYRHGDAQRRGAQWGRDLVRRRGAGGKARVTAGLHHAQERLPHTKSTKPEKQPGPGPAAARARPATRAARASPAQPKARLAPA